MQEMWVRSLGQEDPLEKEMTTHSSILAWGIPWTEEPGELQPTGSQRVGHDWASSMHVLHTLHSFYCFKHAKFFMNLYRQKWPEICLFRNHQGYILSSQRDVGDISSVSTDCQVLSKALGWLFSFDKHLRFIRHNNGKNRCTNWRHVILVQ